MESELIIKHKLKNNKHFLTYKEPHSNCNKYKTELNNLLNFLEHTNLKNKNELIIFDIGSNVGMYSLLFANTFNKYNKIYSFEPIKKTFNFLEKNIKLNNYSNIEIFNFGFTNIEGNYNIGFPNPNINERYNNINKNDTGLCSLFGTENKELIYCDTLDNFIKKNNINKIDFIKIDVEGSEFNILKGGYNTLKNLKPILFFEFNKLTKLLSNINEKELYQYLNDLNYNIYAYKYGYYLDPNELKNLESENISDLLCIPK